MNMTEVNTSSATFLRRILRTAITLIGILGLVASFTHLLFPQTVSSHGSGPPYVKLNGVYVESHPVTQYYTPTEITVGADLASSSAFLVDEEISFEIDTRFFPNPYRSQLNPFGSQNAVDEVEPEFRWDFGDGSAQETGNSVVHSFTEPKTYFVRIEARFPGKTNEFSEVNSVQLDVVPDMSYERPQALIRVNGEEVVNPARDIVEVRPGSKVMLSAVALTGTIASYEWDFGDQTAAQGAETSHRYDRDEYFPVFPLLRVTDENGIIADTYAFIDTPLDQPNVVMRIYYAIVDSIGAIINP